MRLGALGVLFDSNRRLLAWGELPGDCGTAANGWRLRSGDCGSNPQWRKGFDREEWRVRNGIRGAAIRRLRVKSAMTLGRKWGDGREMNRKRDTKRL